jgi:hypothetical protein
MPFCQPLCSNLLVLVFPVANMAWPSSQPLMAPAQAEYPRAPTPSAPMEAQQLPANGVGSLTSSSTAMRSSNGGGAAASPAGKGATERSDVEVGSAGLGQSVSLRCVAKSLLSRWQPPPVHAGGVVAPDLQ